MILAEAIQIFRVERCLDGVSSKGYQEKEEEKAFRMTAKGKLILAFGEDNFRIKTYSGPSSRHPFSRRIGKRTNLYYQEIRGKEDWEVFRE